jgi:predicted DNA-binding transcriptional regulator AlpA
MVAANRFEALLNERALAKSIGMSLASVRRWRLLGQGPKFLKLGSAVRYRPQDSAAWLRTRPTGGSGDGTAR